MDKVFILAQGLGHRWQEGSLIELPAKCKQLVPLGNETIIERTIRQVRRYAEPTLVAWAGEFGHIDCNLLELRSPGNNILQGIVCLNEHWLFKDYSTLFLLGDVIYSNHVIDKIFDGTGFGTVRFYLRWGENIFTGKEASEIFALKLLGEHSQIWQTLMGMDLSNSRLKLWDLWDNTKNSGAVIVGDYTDDLDSPEEWLQFYPKLEECALEDDKQYEN